MNFATMYFIQNSIADFIYDAGELVAPDVLKRLSEIKGRHS
jgi:hypothetical protein